MSEELTLVLQEIKKLEEKTTAQFERLESSLGARIDAVDAKVDSLNDRLDHFESEVTDRLDRHDLRLANIELTIENEIKRDISRVAEGHLDLSRKLDQVLENKVSEDRIFVGMNYLQDQIDDIKEQLSRPA